ncbi:hypothetical protein [Gordonia insulae]|uniref:Uncharacterized protein n=1 Tax=Gordonia insulae TaxID=2420509 RepID=A0A3G8JUX4_9ACTN|nr:hypothetical protein [Gordonia insulae]AZG48686.1 hypothetical protein D7316_05306 [Gordonia insulae]
MHSAWKWVGLAGAVGVAAGGVMVARDQRQRNAYSADDVRDRLHRRHDEAQAREDADVGESP